MEPYPYRHKWERITEAAELLADSASGEPPRTLVSVDWDYFLPFPALAAFTDSQAEMLATGLRRNLEEWFSVERSAAVWRDLAERIEMAGADPDRLHAPDPAEMRLFAETLTERFRFGSVYLADSHAWGSVVAAALHRRSGRQVELISFDAHHDLGYINYPGDTIERSQVRARQRPSCDDWIQAGMIHGTVGLVSIVYPAWRGLLEWEGQPPTIDPEHELFVAAGDWGQWKAQAPSTALARPAELLIVRSSAYSPPWGGADRRFAELVEMLAGEGEAVCLDCLAPAGLSFGAFDGCRPRS